VKQINSYLSALKAAYSQQGWTGKILVPGLFLLFLCFLCSILLSLFPLGSRSSTDATPNPNVLPSAVIGVTPTALFNFDSVTFTPFPTLPAPSAFPTVTSPSSETQTPTQTIPTATVTPLPTLTSPPPTVSGTGLVLITTVNKTMEYVELQNQGNGPVSLNGWKLVSETGSQSCPLSGLIQPNEVLRVWSGKGDAGFSCGFSFNIWNDNQSDPAVLYDAQGKEVSRSP
jgi:hypothetical protein